MPRRKIVRHYFDAPDNRCFYVHNGPTLRNLRDLREALANMTDEQFGEHVKEKRNDFASWVWSVFEDYELQDKLRRRWTRKQSLDTIVRHLAAYYDKWENQNA